VSRQRSEVTAKSAWQLVAGTATTANGTAIEKRPQTLTTAAYCHVTATTDCHHGLSIESPNGSKAKSDTYEGENYGAAPTHAFAAQSSQTVPLPREIVAAIASALADALVADFQANPQPYGCFPPGNEP
jgi:hypothetical protein